MGIKGKAPPARAAPSENPSSPQWGEGSPAALSGQIFPPSSEALKQLPPGEHSKALMA